MIYTMRKKVDTVSALRTRKNPKHDERKALSTAFHTNLPAPRAEYKLESREEDPWVLSKDMLP